jgi:hypothetical protein
VLVSLADDHTATVLDSVNDVTRGNFSPDGRWIAHESIVNGRPEVFVSSLDGDHVRVSTNGGGLPQWRGDGREIYYENAGGDVMAAAVSDAGGLRVAQPVKLFSLCQSTKPATVFRGPGFVSPSPDGSRFLARCAVPDSSDAFGVLLNWRLPPR